MSTGARATRNDKTGNLLSGGPSKGVVAMAAQTKPGTATGRSGRGELDELTLRRAQRGDDSAFRTLVECYQDRVFALCSRLLHGRPAATVEDVAQDTFLQVFRSLAKFAPLGPARLSTWILTIATRRAIDVLRKPSPGFRPLDRDMPDAAGPHTDAENAQLGRAIATAVSALPPQQRAAFLLREYHGFHYGEIARALEVDAGTVKSRLGRARASLRQALAEHMHPTRSRDRQE